MGAELLGDASPGEQMQEMLAMLVEALAAMPDYKKFQVSVGQIESVFLRLMCQCGA